MSAATFSPCIMRARRSASASSSPGFDVELRQFLAGVAREVGLGLRGGDARALGGQFGLDFAQRREGGARRLRQRLEAAIGVDQRAMGRGVEQRALVVLAVDLHQVGGEARSVCALTL